MMEEIMNYDLKRKVAAMVVKVLRGDKNDNK